MSLYLVSCWSHGDLVRLHDVVTIPASMQTRSTLPATTQPHCNACRDNVPVRMSVLDLLKASEQNPHVTPRVVIKTIWQEAHPCSYDYVNEEPIGLANHSPIHRTMHRKLQSHCIS